MKQRALAWLNLAYRMGVHVVWRMPTRALGRHADRDRFVNTVNAEGYLPLPAAERVHFPEFMHCIGCGLCTLACPTLREAPADAWQEPWSFVVGPARSLERTALVAAALAPCTTCTECAAVCPTGVPIPLLAAAVQRRAAEHGGRS